MHPSMVCNCSLGVNSVIIYFALTFAISWTGALIVAASALIRGETLTKQSGILLFPVMIVGPCISGIVLTFLVDGRLALRRLVFRMRPGRLAPVSYLAVPFLHSSYGRSFLHEQI